jgi:hypothetical protein
VVSASYGGARATANAPAPAGGAAALRPPTPIRPRLAVTSNPKQTTD